MKTFYRTILIISGIVLILSMIMFISSFKTEEDNEETSEKKTNDTIRWTSFILLIISLGLLVFYGYQYWSSVEYPDFIINKNVPDSDIFDDVPEDNFEDVPNDVPDDFDEIPE